MYLKTLKMAVNWKNKSNAVLFERCISKCPKVSEKSRHPIAFKSIYIL